MKNEKIMSKQTMWNIATEAVGEYLKREGYQVEGGNSTCTVYPNIVARKKGKLYGIIIDANEVRKQPKYSIGRTFYMLRFARKFDAVPLYASVGIGSANSKRFDQELLYENDPEGYLINFTGLENIDYDIVDKITKKERKEYIINLLGDCYERSDFSMIEKYLAKDCTWYSFYSGVEYNSKKEIMEYYNKKAKAMKGTKINYFLIKFVGKWYELKVKELTLPDGSVKRNATVQMEQPDGEIGLVFEQIKDNEEKVGMVMAIEFNKDGLIKDIFIGNPYAMNFEDYYDYEQLS